MKRKQRPVHKKVVKMPKPTPKTPAEYCTNDILVTESLLSDQMEKQRSAKPAKNPKRKVTKPYKDNSKSEFLKVFGSLTHRHRKWEVWSDFIVMFACSLSNPVDKVNFDNREKRYLKLIQKYNKHEQRAFPKLAALTVTALENNPEQDFLGDIFMDLGLGDEQNGQFFTPYDVCQLMAMITMNDISKEVEKKGYITIHDSCCGAGATLIAGIHEAKKQLEKHNLNFQNHVLVVGQDIDEIAALMCYIQLSLLGVAAYVKVGNAFTDPIRNGESIKNYWFTLMYFSNIWSTRRIIYNFGNLIMEENKDGRKPT